MPYASNELFEKLRNQDVVESFVSTIRPQLDIPPDPNDRRTSSAISGEEMLVASFDEIVRNMKEHEKLKYPESHYEYKRKNVVIGGEYGGKERDVVYVKYDGKQINEDDINIMRSHALAVRKHSIVAGIMNAMIFSPTYLASDPMKRKEIINSLNNLLQTSAKEDLSKDEDVNDNIKLFIDNVANNLSTITGKNRGSIIREVRNSERYFVAEYRQEMIINETTINNKKFMQLDVSYNNALTGHQKRDFMKIHTNPPGWFNRLPEWEKAWFKKHIPTSVSGDWEHFERINQSSAMSHVPGVQNIRGNYLLKERKNGSYEMLSKSIKTGSWVPYDIPKDEIDDRVLNNAEQVMSHLRSEATNKFQEMWSKDKFGKDIDWAQDGYGKALKHPIKPIIFVQSLLSDVFKLGGSDNSLTRKQLKAMKTFKHSPDYIDCEIIAGNDPVNILRIGTAISGFISVHLLRRWVHTDKILKQAERFVDHVKDRHDDLTDQQKNTLIMMNLAREQLLRMRRDTTFPYPGRNFSAFKVAYMQILVECQGGMASFNCKSGKDRTGIEELYSAAMRIYFDKYGVLPKFDDNAENREKFINIFIPLFNSMKVQEAAASNTPGSFGIKDSAKMLCFDIAKKLGLSYINSNNLSEMNKPKEFKIDEQKEAKELRHLSQDNLKSSSVFVSPDDIEIKDRPIDRKNVKPNQTIDGEKLNDVVSKLNRNSYHEDNVTDSQLSKLSSIVDELKDNLGKTITEFKSYRSNAYSNINSKKNADKLLIELDKILRRLINFERAIKSYQDNPSDAKHQIRDVVKDYSNALEKNSRSTLSKAISTSSDYDNLIKRAQKDVNNYLREMSKQHELETTLKKDAPAVVSTIRKSVK